MSNSSRRKENPSLAAGLAIQPEPTPSGPPTRIIHVLIGSKLDGDPNELTGMLAVQELAGCKELSGGIVVLSVSSGIHQLKGAQVLLLQQRGPLYDTRGLGAMLQRVHHDRSGTRVLALLDTVTDGQQLELIRFGVFGCVLNSEPASTIAKAIRSVQAGVPWFPRVLLYEALRCPKPIATKARDVEKLTPRESEILELIGLGLTNKEVARRLGISDTTVKTHLHRVYVKLDESGRFKAFKRNAEVEPRGRSATDHHDEPRSPTKDAPLQIRA